MGGTKKPPRKRQSTKGSQEASTDSPREKDRSWDLDLDLLPRRVEMERWGREGGKQQAGKREMVE
jgi:hypothetical protein